MKKTRKYEKAQFIHLRWCFLIAYIGPRSKLRRPTHGKVDFEIFSVFAKLFFYHGMTPSLLGEKNAKSWKNAIHSLTLMFSNSIYPPELEITSSYTWESRFLNFLVFCQTFFLSRNGSTVFGWKKCENMKKTQFIHLPWRFLTV